MLFVVDARAGVTPGDEELAQILRESKKPVLVLANKIDDPSQETLALEFHRLGFGEPFPLSALHGSNTGDLLDEVVDACPGRSEPRTVPATTRSASRSSAGRTSASRRSSTSWSATERTIVSDVPGTTRDTIDTVLERRRPHVRARRHRRPAPQAQAAAGDRLLLGAARARGGRARRRRARPDRRERGDRRRRHHRRRGGAQGALRDADRALEVGHLEGHDRGRPARAAAPPAPAARLHHDLVATPAAASRGCSTRWPSCTTARRPRADRRAEPLPRRAEGGAPAAVEGRAPPQPPLRRAGLDRGRRASASPSTTPASSRATTATGSRTSCASGSSSRGCRSRSTSGSAFVKAVVVGGGAWGTAFAELLRARGHDVTLAVARDDRRRAVRGGRARRGRRPEPRVPRGARARARRRADAEPRQGPRPGDRRAALDARRATGRSRCSRARTWRRRSPTGCRARR